MASTYTLAAAALQSMCSSAFSSEIANGLAIKHDRLHEALGERGLGGPRLGISPVREVPNTRNRLAWETWLEVRYFDLWDKKVNPAQEVDPRIIADKADKLKNVIAAAQVTKSGKLWFFNVESIEYPLDPTGNSTRFVMTIRVWANNTSLVETSG